MHLLDNDKTTIGNKIIFGTTLWTNYHERRKKENKLSVVEQFQTNQYLLSEKNIKSETFDLLITHYVSNRSVLKKPWNIGLGPSSIIHVSKAIFGHIHYPIYEKDNSITVLCNPWGEGDNVRYSTMELD